MADSSIHTQNPIQELERTLSHLYGDLLDFPLLEKVARTEIISSNLPERIKACNVCSLHIGRKNSVIARGESSAKIAFIGDFPSDGDDAKGSPFVDEAGDLLQKMMVAMALKPEEVYLANLVKCRPPAHRGISEAEIAACRGFLQEQFSTVKAKVIVALGESAARALARSDAPLGKLRGQIFDWNGRQVFCTHHPRDLLQSPQKKKEAWEDLKKVMKAMASQ